MSDAHDKRAAELVHSWRPDGCAEMAAGIADLTRRVERETVERCALELDEKFPKYTQHRVSAVMCIGAIRALLEPGR